MRLFFYLCLFTSAVLFTGNGYLLSNEDANHEKAMSMLKIFLYDSQEREAYALKNPAAAKAEGFLSLFPKDIQKRLLLITEKIIDKDRENSQEHINRMKNSGPEAAFNGFSGDIQREVKAIAVELEKNPKIIEKMSKSMQEVVPTIK